MPLSRLPNKQGVEILDQPIGVDGPVTNGDPAPAIYKPVIVGGEALDFGHGISPQDIVSLWMTRGGAPVVGGWCNEDAGGDAALVSFVAPTGTSPLRQTPLGTAGYVYEPVSGLWMRARGNETSGAFSMPGNPTVTILNATTNAVGANWTAFAAQSCRMLDVANVTGTDIEYRRNAAGNAMRIPDGGSRLILGITNADQIQIRRVDQSNTQVVVTAEAMT